MKNGRNYVRDKPVGVNCTIRIAGDCVVNFDHGGAENLISTQGRRAPNEMDTQALQY